MLVKQLISQILSWLPETISFMNSHFTYVVTRIAQTINNQTYNHHVCHNKRSLYDHTSCSKYPYRYILTLQVRAVHACFVLSLVSSVPITRDWNPID
ncbi:hypothetical protein HanRHA438_Chr12g0573341 [Helianthus annuus]|nr:hypothetical protein HanRHA438_Chr12g0573341 [Helianthus annuus]